MKKCLILIDKASRELDFSTNVKFILNKKYNIKCDIDQQDIYNKGDSYDFFIRCKK